MRELSKFEREAINLWASNLGSPIFLILLGRVKPSMY